MLQRVDASPNGGEHENDQQRQHKVAPARGFVLRANPHRLAVPDRRRLGRCRSAWAWQNPAAILLCYNVLKTSFVSNGVWRLSTGSCHPGTPPRSRSNGPHQQLVLTAHSRDIVQHGGTPSIPSRFQTVKGLLRVELRHSPFTLHRTTTGWHNGPDPTISGHRRGSPHRPLTPHQLPFRQKTSSDELYA